MDRMKRHPSSFQGGLVIGLLLVGFSSAFGQEGNDEEAHTHGSVRYGLMEKSTFQQGCFEGCACPVTEEMPMRGGFVLTRTGTDADGFHTYDVTEVKWRVLSSNLETHLDLTGTGTYRVKPDTATGVQQLRLRLQVGDQGEMAFDSGLVPGGYLFPKIDIVVTVNDFFCFDTVLHVVAAPAPPPPPLPRHATFVLHREMSSVELVLFTGGSRGKLGGEIRLFLGDPEVPVIALAGMVGLSVDSVRLVAPEMEPNLPGVPVPLVMVLNPHHKSIGSYNTITGEIGFDLHLVAEDGGLPVPMPVHMRGILANGGLDVRGDNGNVADGTIKLKITAFEVKPPPPAEQLMFSTEIGFGSASNTTTSASSIVPISDGDLLSRRGFVVRRNRELTGHLGIMPIVPDLGLDAVMVARPGEIWFSFEEKHERIWSETLARWLKHGDLLSERGRVVLANERLIAAFGPMPVVEDVGLDAITRAPNGALLFSVETGFFAEKLGRHVRHGDLLSSHGRIVRTNVQLLENFHPQDLTLGPAPPDYGLDAIVLRPEREIWFSTEHGFHDELLGWVSDGDLLSTRGHVVVRNRDLVSAFHPVEDVDNFGLDAVNAVVPVHPGDFDFDGDVDRRDRELFEGAFSGPAVASESPELGDFDGDGDVDMNDHAVLQRCLSGEGVVSDVECDRGLFEVESGGEGVMTNDE